MHPRYQQAALRDFCRKQDIAVVAYASLGCGDLLGHQAVTDLAAKHDKTPAQV